MRTAYLADRTFTPQGIETGVAVIVEQGEIVAVTRELPADAEIVHLTGKTLIPGLIDIHIHGRQGQMSWMPLRRHYAPLPVPYPKRGCCLGRHHRQCADTGYLCGSGTGA